MLWSLTWDWPDSSHLACHRRPASQKACSFLSCAASRQGTGYSAAAFSDLTAPPGTLIGPLLAPHPLCRAAASDVRGEQDQHLGQSSVPLAHCPLDLHGRLIRSSKEGEAASGGVFRVRLSALELSEPTTPYDTEKGRHLSGDTQHENGSPPQK